VSIVKAGCDLVGRHAGAVRPPLTGLKPEELAELDALIHRANAKLAAAA
jgi:5-dehydro-4-deoxyglucarate dehydratase